MLGGLFFFLKINIPVFIHFKVCYPICSPFHDFQGFDLLNSSQTLLETLEVGKIFVLGTGKLRFTTWGDTECLLIIEHCSCNT